MLFGLKPFGQSLDFLRFQLSNGLDGFPLITWFVVPLLLLFPLDKKWFEPKFVFQKSVSPKFLLGLALVFFVVTFSISVIPYIPQLSNYYFEKTTSDARVRESFILLSWLPGWELMFRYWLPKVLTDLKKGAIWFAVVPLYEVGYHLIKPYPETIAMAVFSIISTIWVFKKRNTVLPSVLHLWVEIILIGMNRSPN